MNNNKIYNEKIKPMLEEMLNICNDNGISAHVQLLLDPVDDSKVPNSSTTSFSVKPEHDEYILRLQDVSLRGWIPLSVEQITKIYGASQEVTTDTNAEEIHEIVDIEKMN